MNRLVSLVVGVLMLSACAPGDQGIEIVPVGSAGDVLAEARKGWVDAYNAGDGPALTSYFAADAVMLAPDREPVSGRAAIGPYVETFFEGDPAVLEVTDGEIRFVGRLAVERASYTVRTGQGADASVRTGKYVIVWQKGGDGSWEIIWDMWNASEGPAKSE